MEEPEIQSPPDQEKTGVQQVPDAREHLTVFSNRFVKKVGEDLLRDCAASGLIDDQHAWDAAELQELSEIEDMIVHVEASLKNTDAYTLLKVKLNKKVTRSRKANQNAGDVWELHIASSGQAATKDGEDHTETNHPAGIGRSAPSSSNISPPTMSTVGPKDSGLHMAMLTSQQMAFPDSSHPRINLQYRCATSHTEVNWSAGIGSSAASSSTISRPAKSTVGLRDSGLHMAMLTSQQMLLFPGPSHPKTNLQYKCATAHTEVNRSAGIRSSSSTISRPAKSTVGLRDSGLHMAMLTSQQMPLFPGPCHSKINLPYKCATAHTEVNRSTCVGSSASSSSNISQPTKSTVGLKDSGLHMAMLTSQQMSLFPESHHSRKNLRYKCANCGRHFATRHILVSHVMESEGGNSSCRTYYRQRREYRWNEKSAFQNNPVFPQFPDRGISQNKEKADDNIQNLKERRHTDKRKIDDGNHHYQTKKHK